MAKTVSFTQSDTNPNPGYAPESIKIIGKIPESAMPTGSQIVESGRATLVLGVKTVTTANVLTGSNILLTVQSLGTVTAPKAVAVTGRVNATSFTITSSDLTDTSVVGYAILA